MSTTDRQACVIDGCSEPRYVKNGKRHARCEQHQKAAWVSYSKGEPTTGRGRKKGGDTPPVKPKRSALPATHREVSLPSVCGLCGRTPEDAADWSRRGVFCYTCTPVPAPAQRLVLIDAAGTAARLVEGRTVGVVPLPSDAVEYGAAMRRLTKDGSQVYFADGIGERK